MASYLSSKRVKNNYSKTERKHLCCKVCSKILPDEYFVITLEKPKTKFNVCGNDCEAIIWRILREIKSNNKEIVAD